ncbi:MAG: DUF11 domain-containing protein, partial [Clostridiales bacterium]|nr:DUF11 domain-containing protein [Clostridiales bacterium]
DGTATVTYNGVNVGDEITYSISYYNYQNKAVDVVISDALDDGVDFVSAADENGDLVTSGYDSAEHTYTWNISDVSPLTTVTVTLTVRVNENAKLTESADETASVENQATVTVGDVENQTDIVVNELNEGEEENPSKVISENSTSGYTDDPETAVDSDGNTVVTYDSVSTGSMIEYVISYYNHYNTATTVTIEDALDEGVDFISASGADAASEYYDPDSTEANYISYIYDETTHTVTWTITNAAALTEGAVTLVVQVNENAKDTDDGEDTATVENQATVTIGDVENDTEIVVNPIDPDEPSDPEKVVSAASEAGVDGANVSAGDRITYTISYYNHTNGSAVVTIEDALDDGVDFVSASCGGVTLVYDDSDTVTDGNVTISYDEENHSVTWTIDNVSAFTGGTVDLTVEVNSDAAAETQVVNEADVTVGDNKATTNLVSNPVDDEPETPVKSVNVGDGTEVSAGDRLVYTISYYNNLGTAADITIVDVLDEGVTYISSSDGGVYDADTHTVTWTLSNVNAYKHGEVTVTVNVNENARTAASGEIASVVNDADVTVGNQAKQTTNFVENPLESDEPVNPTKSVDVGDGTEVSAGDTLVYTITYYNHLNTSATVTITDTLEEGLTFVSVSDGGTYDEDTRTVTWTLEDVSAFTEGTVTLKVEVNSDIDSSADNTAEVSIGGASAVSTNTVTNPVKETSETTIVKTGDNSRFLLWLILLIASAAGMCTLGVYEQKRRRFGRAK